MRNAQIFISYRRNDDEFAVKGIYKRLCDTFGKNNVFLDEANHVPGNQFRETIRTEIGKADLLLMIVGENWNE